MIQNSYYQFELFDLLQVGVIIFDQTLTIRYVNNAYTAMLGLTDQEIIGYNIEDIFIDYFVISLKEFRRTSPIYSVIKRGTPVLGVERKNPAGRVYLAHYIPINHELFMINATDITYQKLLEEKILASHNEIDLAFSLTLPNSKVEKKMRSTPEYIDTYDQQTGMITIEEIIPDGCYKHVVNALKVLADLNKLGALQTIGIDKDILVKAIIFHDIGKVQPVLKKGDVVNPLETFEQSQIHAERSSDLGKCFYGLSEEICTIIRYHHHTEQELPEDFPKGLLPMYRLLRLIDGLSAAITRRKAQISLEVSGDNIIVEENNPHPRYNGRRIVSLLSGREWTE